MNGFNDRGLDEGNFGDSKGPSLKSFDAFPKTKQTYVTSTTNGGIATILVTIVCIWLTFSEFARWMAGNTTHTFSVEKGVAHDLQMNLDIIIAMRCDDLHINVQDASGDRIVASEKLHKDPTTWYAWKSGADEGAKGREARKERAAQATKGSPAWLREQTEQYRRQEDVHDYLSKARGRRLFNPTPRMRRGSEPDACRVYGSLEGNKVQGDFHITARGHGYLEMGEHLDHQAFNFSHHINELSFGPYFPKLQNPLDAARTTTDHHFYKYQYFLSVVPTIYTDAAHKLTSSTPPPISSRSHVHSTNNPSPHEPDAEREGRGSFNPAAGLISPRTVYTNQYAVTEHSHTIGEDQVPGIFFKYDIEPILLTVAEEWGGILGLIVRCVNVVAGVMVAGGWIVRLSEWIVDIVGRRRKRDNSVSGGGLLYGGKESTE